MKAELRVSLLLLCVINSVLGSGFPFGGTKPEQIHLSFGEKVTDIVVTWVTQKKADVPIVRFGVEDLDHKVEGKQKLFVDGGKEKRKIYIHKVTLRDLDEDTTYFYKCGSSKGWSKNYSFKTPKLGSKWSPKLAIYGDLGAKNPVSLKHIINQAKAGMFNAILHVGDFAYDMNSENGKVADKFMRQIEPAAAIVPYMTAVGNHENWYNFSHYRHRFSMPGNSENMYYSFTLGPARFIVFSTEAYYFYGATNIALQYKWLEHELRRANRPENRRRRPWVITVGHRPMYCSDRDGDDCTKKYDRIRSGIPTKNGRQYGLEKLFYDYAVDVEIFAHEHSYERTWPVYDYKIYPNNFSHIVDPKAPVHIISGSAGCVEKLDKFNKTRPNWSAFRVSEYGFGRMKIYNSTHLFFDQLSIKYSSKVVDKFWIIKNSHGRYAKGELDLESLGDNEDEDKELEEVEDLTKEDFYYDFTPEVLVEKE